MKRHTYSLALLLVGSILLIGAGRSWAIGTAADTTISNTASVQFTISGITATANSNQEDFTVDRKVRMVVTSLGDAAVIAGLNNFVLPFRVDNESNTAAGTDDYFRLTITGGSDDFDMDTVRLYRDENGNGLLDGGDTLLFTGASGAAYETIGNGTGANSGYYLIVANCPASGGTPDTGTSGLEAIYNLVATAWNGAVAGDGIMVADSDGNSQGGAAEIVFADPAGTITGDAVNGGYHSDEGTYTTSTSLGVAKLASGSTSGYNIPGDIVTYDITVTNGDATAAATNVIVTDAIPTNTTYDSFVAADCNGTREWNTAGGWVAAEPATKADVTGIRCTIATLAAGGSETVTFKVSID